ncbi:hypothetical protein BGZ83_011718 [Gryganskiella cystojenkinii]|nr:hypothetical protein BGZ83_011718 [Gryganskiella cystojenkinii]
MNASTIRSLRAPIHAAARHYSSSVLSSTSASAATGQHSTQKLVIASAVSAVVGVDVTYAYFTYFKKADN